MVGESPVNLECKVTKKLALGSHHMFLAQVVAVHVDDGTPIRLLGVRSAKLLSMEEPMQLSLFEVVSFLR